MNRLGLNDWWMIEWTDTGDLEVCTASKSKNGAKALLLSEVGYKYANESRRGLVRCVVVTVARREG